MIAMLEKLLTSGINENYFEIKLLGQLEKSCCSHSITEVIDYDKTKESVSAKAGLQQPKSADALKIIAHSNRIDFIELKGFEHFILYHKNSRDFNKTLNEQIKKFNLAEKISDSLFILSFIVNSIKLTKNEKTRYKAAEKNFILVVDIDATADPIKDRLISLIFLSLKNTIDTIPSSPLENFNKSKLLSCMRIDEYYRELMNSVSPHL